MKSYYATNTRIRYYGQMPTNVTKFEDGVLVTGIKSTVFGEDVVADWRAQLETATDEPFDLSRRRETAHESLANMTLDVDGLYVFTKRWGFLAGESEKNGRLLSRLRHIGPLQNLLQRAWKGDPEALAKVAQDVKARVDVGTTGVDIAVVDLWNLVRLMFLRDYRASRTKVCGNPDCHSPYFLQERRGQKYCSHKCAVLMNVRRFREREAKAKTQTERSTQR